MPLTRSRYDDDFDDEPRFRRSSRIRCSDRTCGALDCPSCYPDDDFKDDDEEEDDKKKSKDEDEE